MFEGHNCKHKDKHTFKQKFPGGSEKVKEKQKTKGALREAFNSNLQGNQ